MTKLGMHRRLLEGRHLVLACNQNKLKRVQSVDIYILCDFISISSLSHNVLASQVATYALYRLLIACQQIDSQSCASSQEHAYLSVCFVEKKLSFYSVH